MEEMESRKNELPPSSIEEISHEETVPAAAVEEPAVKKEPKPSTSSQQVVADPSTLDQTAFQANPDSHNGAIRENYSWSQNYDDVDVKITVPETITRAKQVTFMFFFIA